MGNFSLFQLLIIIFLSYFGLFLSVRSLWVEKLQIKMIHDVYGRVIRAALEKNVTVWEDWWILIDERRFSYKRMMWTVWKGSNFFHKEWQEALSALEKLHTRYQNHAEGVQ